MSDKNGTDSTMKRRPSHPGALLADILPDAGATPVEMCEQLGIPLWLLESIMREEAPITTEIAEKLGSKFGDGADIWLRMQAAYDNWREIEAVAAEVEEYLKYPIVHEPPRENVSYQCPCCKYLTLKERGGYDICPVCYWEDDGQDDPYADQVRGGPNYHLSLTQARENFKAFGAVEERLREFARPPTEEELPS